MFSMRCSPCGEVHLGARTILRTQSAPISQTSRHCSRSIDTRVLFNESLLGAVAAMMCTTCTRNRKI
jgi:hypothetical protein